ncbi:MAG: hypothetical protein R2741_15490 [Methanolobus sp.]
MIINSIAVSTIVSAEAGIVTMMADTGIPEYGILVSSSSYMVALCKKLSRSDRWNESLDCSLKMASIPLLVTFVAMVLFKVSEL